MVNKKFNLRLGALSICVLLASCGGGGFYDSNTSNNDSETISPTVTASILSVGQSKSSLNAGGEDSLTLTIRTMDSKGGVVANANVKVEIKDAINAGASLSTPSSLSSDSNGIVTTNLTILNSTLAQRLNRTITVVISSGSTSQELQIPVNGAKLSISSDSNILDEGNNATVTLKAVDAIGSSLVNVNANLIDIDGNDIAGTVLTNASGIAVFTIPYNLVKNSKNNKLEISGKVSVQANNIYTNLLTTDSLTIVANVLNATLQNTTVSSNIAIGESKAISVKVNASSQAELTGKTVKFATTNGTVSPAVASIENIQYVDGQWAGTAQTTLVGEIASIATISAQFGTSTINIGQIINPGTPATISIQSESSVLAPGANTKIIAVVKDKNGSPVPNVSVNFKTLKDTSSNGQISQPTAITDSTGRATVIYTAGSSQTLGGGVEIQAYVNGAVVPSPVYSSNLLLTVSMQSAFITLSQNHLVLKVDGDNTNYYKEFAASVVDTAGNPIANQKISISLDLVSFYKGYFSWIKDYTYSLVDSIWTWSPTTKWSRDYTTYQNNIASRITTFVECPSNEFPSPVSILSATNSNLGTQGSFITDSQGMFSFKVRYGRNYANWLRVNINASTTVSTKDNLTALSFTPPVATDDIDQVTGNWRPDQNSPYGTDYSTCLNYK